MEEYVPVASERMPRWRVVSPEGALAGELTLPARAQLVQAGEDWVLLRTTDELDVVSFEVRPVAGAPAG